MGLKEEISTKIIQCKRCDHEWVRRGKLKDIRQCPKCKSAWWDTDYKIKPKWSR